jgi:hypothetical protein
MQSRLTIFVANWYKISLGINKAVEMRFANATLKYRSNKLEYQQTNQKLFKLLNRSKLPLNDILVVGD